MSDVPVSAPVQRSASPARLSIFQLEAELAELMEFRENEELTPEERQAVDTQIAEYISRELTKVDNLRAYMRHCQMMAEGARAEADVQLKRAISWKTRLDYLKGFCLDAMNVLGKTKLEGRTGYLLAKVNGGKQALTIAPDSRLLPEAFVLYRGWMSAEAFAAIPEQVRGRQDFQLEREPRTEMIRAELEKPCACCEGTGRFLTPEGDYPDPECHGTGKKIVPGAKLEPRGSHVEIK